MDFIVNQKINGKIYAYFLFQYSLLIPFMSFIPSSLLVAISSMGIFCFSLLNNKVKTANRNVCYVLIILPLIILLKIISTNSTYLLLSNFFIYSLVPILISMNKFDRKSFFKTAYKLAIINFVLNLLNPFMPGYNYMRFGYGMLLTFCMVYIHIRYTDEENNPITDKINFFILIISGLEIFVYGARGSFLSILIFLCIDIFFINKKKIFRNISLVLCTFLIYINLSSILDFLYLVSLKIGVGSYSIAKYRMQLNGGWAAASSGRDELYLNAIEQFRNHPFFGGEIDSSLQSGEYVHNIFLQMLNDFGAVGLSVLLIFLSVCFIRLFHNRYAIEDKMILSVLFTVSIGRLLFSSIIWQRPEFWLLLCFVLTMKKSEYKII